MVSVLANGIFLAAHQLDERIADRPLDDGMRQCVGAGIDGLERAQLARNMHGGADAVLIVIADDLLQQLHRHQRDHRPRAPALLLERQLQDVGLLLGDMLVQQRLVLLEVADAHRDSVAMASRVGDQIAGRKDAGRKDPAGALVAAQRQDVLGPVAGVEHGRDAGIEETCQRRLAFRAIRRSRRRIHFAADVEAAAQVNVDVDQAGDQIFAGVRQCGAP